MNYIYLIGTSGAARTPNENLAAGLEELSGYSRCTREQYHQRMREIRALDIAPDQPNTTGD